MPLLIHNYIFKKISLGTVMLTTLMVFAIWLTQSLRYLDMIVNRSVSLEGYFYLILFLIPDLAVLILPICLFVSVIYHYNKLLTDHEITVLRASGMSNFSLSLPIFSLTAIVVALTFIINVFILPQTFSKFKNMEHQLRQQFTGAMFQEGRFNNFRGVTAYVEQRLRSGKLKGVLIYNKLKTPYTLMAKEGKVVFVKGKLHLVLEQGIRQEIDPKTKALSTFTFDHLDYDLSQFFKVEDERTVKPYEKSLTELLNPPESLDPEQVPKYRAAAHTRILQPFFGIIYVLIALVALLVGPYRRRGRSLKITAAFFATFIYHALTISMFNMNGIYYTSVYVAYGLYFILMVVLGSLFFAPQFMPRVRGRKS